MRRSASISRRNLRKMSLGKSLSQISCPNLAVLTFASRRTWPTPAARAAVPDSSQARSRARRNHFLTYSSSSLNLNPIPVSARPTNFRLYVCRHSNLRITFPLSNQLKTRASPIIQTRRGVPAATRRSPLRPIRAKRSSTAQSAARRWRKRRRCFATSSFSTH